MMNEKKLIDIDELKQKAKEVNVVGSFKSEDCDRHIQLAIAEQTEALVAVNTRIAEALERAYPTEQEQAAILAREDWLREQHKKLKETMPF